VRPIFWSTRPKSYVCQTSAWDQFPNGRWGLSSAPSFGDLKDYHIFYEKLDKKKMLAQLGDEVPDEQAVWKIFELFISGEPNKNGNIVSCYKIILVITVPNKRNYLFIIRLNLFRGVRTSFHRRPIF